MVKTFLVRLNKPVIGNYNFSIQFVNAKTQKNISLFPGYEITGK